MMDGGGGGEGVVGFLLLEKENWTNGAGYDKVESFHFQLINNCCVTLFYQEKGK